MQSPAALGPARTLEVPDHSRALGVYDRALQERAQHNVLRENHRAPDDLAFEAAIRSLQGFQMSGRLAKRSGYLRLLGIRAGIRHRRIRDQSVRRHLVPRRLSPTEGSSMRDILPNGVRSASGT